jgi:hypothetical protein
MRTKQEMEAYARALAEEHFYADVDDRLPWEPFEHYPEEWVAVEVDTLADAVEQAMRWVQEGTLT